jgi:hypothetical protein
MQVHHLQSYPNIKGEGIKVGERGGPCIVHGTGERCIKIFTREI